MSKALTMEFTPEELRLISEVIKHSAQEELGQSVAFKIDKVFNSIKLLKERMKEAKNMAELPKSMPSTMVKCEECGGDAKYVILCPLCDVNVCAQHHLCKET